MAGIITDPKIYKPDNILDDLFSEFRETLRKEKHRDVVLITEPRSSDDKDVLIDLNRVKRVVRNLFQNALGNTKSGYIKIGYYLRDENVHFYVVDSGKGFFKCKEFFQTEDLNESLNKHLDLNSAVNITLARKLIELMRGTVRIECNGMTGTGIYFSIPARSENSPDISNNKTQNSMIAI